jgi:hypothetical protein
MVQSVAGARAGGRPVRVDLRVTPLPRVLPHVGNAGGVRARAMVATPASFMLLPL